MTAGITGLGAAAPSRAKPIAAGNIDGPREETSLLAFFSILLAHRRMIAVWGLIGMMIFGALALSTAVKYESRASFIVKGSQSPVTLPGMTSSLGLLLTAQADFSQSVVFYAELAMANVILKPVAADSYATSDSHGVKRPLTEIFGIKEPNRELAVEAAAREILRNSSTIINTRSGVVVIAVNAIDPLLAQELATRILAEVGLWSRVRAHAEAQRQREFVEARAADAQAKLSQAEEALSAFLATNRQYFSPDLVMEHDRLQRQVAMRQEIYNAVAQALEQARIDEGNDRAAINVVEVADFPVEPQRIAALRQTIVGLAAGTLVGMILAFLRQRADEKRLVSA